MTRTATTYKKYYSKLPLREIAFSTTSDCSFIRRVNRRIPQGSVLSSFLGKLGFNQVHEAVNHLGVQIICYADETPIIARGKKWIRTLKLTATAVRQQSDSDSCHSERPRPGTKCCCPKNRSPLILLSFPYATPTNHMASNAIFWSSSY